MTVIVDNKLFRLPIIPLLSDTTLTILNIPFIQFFLPRYKSATPTKLKIIDAYLTYVFFTGVIQFVYCCLVGTFPFNAFLSGFISCVGCFILGVCLRLQVRIILLITHLFSSTFKENHSCCRMSVLVTQLYCNYFTGQSSKQESI